MEKNEIKIIVLRDGDNIGVSLSRETKRIDSLIVAHFVRGLMRLLELDSTTLINILSVIDTGILDTGLRESIFIDAGTLEKAGCNIEIDAEGTFKDYINRQKEMDT